MRSEDIILASDGLSIAAHMVWPEREDPAPALILCHGFGSCKENQGTFAALAAARGWGVLSFDFRGHGQSDGCMDSHAVNDIGAALAWLRGQPGIDPRRIAVRGASMGGYFAIHAASQWCDLAACVAVNPLDEAALQAMLRDARDPTTCLGQWRATGSGFPRVMGCDLSCWLESSDLYTAAAHCAPRPLLLIHCAGDEQVPVRISDDVYAAAGEPKTLWRLAAGHHCFASRDPNVAARALDWLTRAI